MTPPLAAIYSFACLTIIAGAAPPAPPAGAAAPVRHTTEAALHQQVTAKDLIGRDVYDRQNDHVGEIVDIALGGVVPEELKNALAKSDRDDHSAAGAAARDDTGRQAKATDRARDERPAEERVQAFATSTVFISVGGVLGMGSDLLRAPLSALGYDRRHDRIVLDLSSDELRSILKTAGTLPRRTPRAAVIIYGTSR